MEMIVFNDNLYLAYCYLPVNPNVPGNPLISQALTPRPYIRGISDWNVTFINYTNFYIVHISSS